MSNPFDGLNDAFGTEPTELQKHVEKVKPTLKKTETEDVKQDYEISRAALHSLVMKGQEAVDGILEVAQASDHPRAYEVAATTIKNVADTADKLIDLQKKMKELDAEDKKNAPSTVNNTMFVGSTAELQKMLKQQKEINKKDEK
ncbi:terminase DNA packaging enzyme small subunit [Prochlorococcus phage P-RSM4]|uniref:Terminase DNA packaging enzyme small subunit n=1 Tax=Prochlorococcus phage P-RSM4 TaxID=444862 RepID=E3SM03_9CAUD|nr:terminase small subunit [Prochlorococcus phage P-RSM4]ADO98501.1 terminase DNA packaging enzyme small subunit [Prochlorococcus phage P-RSM4]|tara:strand:+ start:48 stop:479 length:432 start_codon:yes stop_codon:yes gene_type:complete